MSNTNVPNVGNRVAYLNDVIERLMERLVEEWHLKEYDPQNTPLHEYCGLTQEEYKRWIEGKL